MASFQYYEDIEEVRLASNGFVGIVPSGIEGSENLFSSIAQSLGFPAYFGMNWDALRDCIFDFSWVNDYDICIIHQDIPILEKYELEMYIDILREACVRWPKYPQHNVQVFFPKECATRLDNVRPISDW